MTVRPVSKPPPSCAPLRNRVSMLMPTKSDVPQFLPANGARPDDVRCSPQVTPAAPEMNCPASVATVCACPNFSGLMS